LSVKPIRPHLTRRSIIAAASGLALAGGWSNSGAAQIDASGLPDAADAMTQVMPAPAPCLVFTNAEGKRLTLADYAGHALVVNIWATWCGPCVMEIPSLAALALKLKAGGGLVLPVSIDISGAAAVRPFYASHGIRTLPILLDQNGDSLRVLSTNGVPVTIIINAAGQIVARLDGAANWNTGNMVKFLRSLGSKPPSGAAAAFIPA
jgi:thiol-disulfide isomerase/thioredoxin